MHKPAIPFLALLIGSFTAVSTDPIKTEPLKVTSEVDRNDGSSNGDNANKDDPNDGQKPPEGGSTVNKNRNVRVQVPFIGLDINVPTTWNFWSTGKADPVDEKGSPSHFYVKVFGIPFTQIGETPSQQSRNGDPNTSPGDKNRRKDDKSNQLDADTANEQ